MSLFEELCNCENIIYGNEKGEKKKENYASRSPKGTDGMGSLKLMTGSFVNAAAPGCFLR